MKDMELIRYIFARLHGLGVRSVFGVPGDYNLTALDFLEDAGLKWVGNCNELNAGYAADGYGRIKGIAALVTAVGVGELSAINAIAGAYAERIPVVHIVGSPSTRQQDLGMCLHHSLGDGDFEVFANMYKSITVAHTSLTDMNTAVSEIDRVLKACVQESRPVYVALPTDMVLQKISLDFDLVNATLSNYPDKLNGHDLSKKPVQKIADMITSAQCPFIIVDGLARAYDIQDEVDAFVRMTGIPTSTTPAGKGIINESYPNVCRMYKGKAGDPGYEAFVENCDLIICLAPLGSDLNTFRFSTVPPQAKAIIFRQYTVTIMNDDYLAPVKTVLQELLHNITERTLPSSFLVPALALPAHALDLLPSLESDSLIDQETFWFRCSRFLASGDIVLAECGTSSIGALDLMLPAKVSMINSALWASIGFMLGAAQGAALALRDLYTEQLRDAGRTILFIGDGSLQMSVQAISDIIRNRLDVIIFVINNNGYTIERYIHGMHAKYNDVQPWRYLEAPSFFGADLDDPTYPITLRKATTWGEMTRALDDPAVSSGKGVVMVEVMMQRDDAPEALKKIFG